MIQQLISNGSSMDPAIDFYVNWKQFTLFMKKRKIFFFFYWKREKCFWPWNLIADYNFWVVTLCKKMCNISVCICIALLTVLIIFKIYVWLYYIIYKSLKLHIAFLFKIFSILWISTLKQNWEIFYHLHNSIILFLFIIFKLIYFSFCYFYLYFLAFVFKKRSFLISET